MISFTDALTGLTQEAGGHAAHAAMLLAGTLASRRGSLPPVTEPDAWDLTEEEVTRALAMLTKPSGVPAYSPASTPRAEPGHLAAVHVGPGDQLHCQGDMLCGHHKPGWCEVVTTGAQHAIGPYGVGAVVPSFGMACGRLWAAQDPEEMLLVARRLDAALAS